MGEFRMPSLGADMEGGTLVEWRVKPGDSVTHGQVVAEVETDKGLIEIEIFESGVVDDLVVQPGTNVPVGAVLAHIRGATGTAAPAPVSAPPPAAAPTVGETPAIAPPPPSDTARQRVSPRARKRAEELGIALAGIAGTGAAGEITVADVERGAAQAPAPPSASAPVPKRDPKAAMRSAIAAAMTHSKREIPHYYLATQIDMSRALNWLEATNLTRSVADRLLYSVLLLRAVALAARKVPEMNGHWIDGAFHPSGAVNVGVAISLRSGGLVAPATHDVDKKSVDELMPQILDLVKRVRAGVMRSSEISDATITVTSVGEQGIETVYGVIYPPQVAIVGFGKISQRPWVSAGAVTARPLVNATLAADHRASDGHRGGLFLTAIDHLLQEPEKL